MPSVKTRVFNNKNVSIFNRKSQGMTFIEVLVSLIILVTGLLGAIALQATSQKGSFDSMQRSLATSLAQEIIEKMRSNQAGGFFLNNYNGIYGETLNPVPLVACNAVAVTCTPLEMVTHDLYEWEFAIMGFDITNNGAPAGGLVEGRGCINHVQNAITVVVSWRGGTATQDVFNAVNYDVATGAFVNSCGTASNQRRQVVIQAFIN